MGFFSGLASAVGGLVKGVASAARTIAPITSFVPGPVGMISKGLTAFGGLSGAVGRSPAAPVGFNPTPFTPTRLRLPAPTTNQRKAAGMMDFLPDIGVPGPGVFSSKGCPPGYHLAKDGSGRCVRNRRMNPLNHRANMRAARRLVAFRKAVVRTEKALRKAVPPSARRRAPAGHRARLTHD